MEKIMNENELNNVAGGAAQQKRLVDVLNYTVKRGDCLDAIARKHHMSGWVELYNFMDNARRIGSNANLLQIGTVIKVPLYVIG